MNKKGFTLIELLAVIVIMGLVATIAVVSVNVVNGSIKDNLLREKISFIEEAAILMGQDRKGYILSRSEKYNNNPCTVYTVSELVNNYYLDADYEDRICATSANTSECATRECGCVSDPRNDNNYLDLYKVIVYYRNNRIYAKFDKDNNLSCVASTPISLTDYTVGYFTQSENGTRYTNYNQAFYLNEYLLYRSESQNGTLSQACGLINNHLVCLGTNADSLQAQCNAASGNFDSSTNTCSDNVVSCNYQSDNSGFGCCYTNEDGSAGCCGIYDNGAYYECY